MLHKKDEYLRSRNILWVEYEKKSDASDDKYKLHISIHPDKFAEVKDELDKLLHEALDANIISYYKTLNLDYVKQQQLDQTDDAKNIKRQMHMPFIIMLDNNLDEKSLYQIAHLCEKIESILSNIQAGNEDFRAVCDLTTPLPHIIFRQANLDAGGPEQGYVGAFDKLAPLLQSQGERSEYYTKICLLMTLNHHLISHFTTKTDGVLEILQKYQNQLLLEKNDGATKGKIISNKIAEIAQLMQETRELVNYYKTKPYDDFNSAKVELIKAIEMIRKNARNTIRFSQSENAALIQQGFFGKMKKDKIKDAVLTADQALNNKKPR